jgi:hypothetical protein
MCLVTDVLGDGCSWKRMCLMTNFMDIFFVKEKAQMNVRIPVDTSH